MYGSRKGKSRKDQHPLLAIAAATLLRTVSIAAAIARVTVVRLRLVAQAIAGIATSELGPADVDNWFPIFWKTHYRLTSKLLISFLVPKNHKINAFGSHLYMNLKKNDFWIC